MSEQDSLPFLLHLKQVFCLRNNDRRFLLTGRGKDEAEPEAGKVIKKLVLKKKSKQKQV